jgi:hypothetical protein
VAVACRRGDDGGGVRKMAGAGRRIHVEARPLGQCCPAAGRADGWWGLRATLWLELRRASMGAGCT